MNNLSICLLYLLPMVICRGPHHPRGEKKSHEHIHYQPKRSIEDQTNDQDHFTPTKLTQDNQLLHDKEHIREDLEDANGMYDGDMDLESMTDEELEFHYFQLHDFDKNTKLDGLEILQAIQHTAHVHNMETNNNGTDENNEEIVQETDLDYFIELIDRVLAEDDMNHDGYLSYPEYVVGRMKDGENQVKYSAKPTS